jgi:hypothetical protein
MGINKATNITKNGCEELILITKKITVYRK